MHSSTHSTTPVSMMRACVLARAESISTARMGHSLLLLSHFCMAYSQKSIRSIDAYNRATVRQDGQICGYF